MPESSFPKNVGRNSTRNYANTGGSYRKRSDEVRRCHCNGSIKRRRKMADQARKAEQFRALPIPGKTLVLFQIWDAGSAKAVATGGAKAIATSSWSVANTNGLADGEHIPLALAIENLRRIVPAPDLPVTIALESGYGDASEVVRKTIALAIEAGSVGCNLEDSF